MAKNSFRSLFAKAKQRDAYWVSKAINDFTESLFVLMQEREMTKAELARKIKKSPAYVTKVFRGNSNFTIDSMVRLVRALDGQLCIYVGRQESHVHWFDVIAQPPVPAPELLGAGFKLTEPRVYEVEALGVPANEEPLAA